MPVDKLFSKSHMWPFRYLCIKKIEPPDEMEQLFKNPELVNVLALFGGITVIIQSVIAGIWSLIQARTLAKWTTRDQNELEALKGRIDGNNSMMSVMLARTTPAEILQRRLNAFDDLWSFAMATKKKFPSSFTLYLSILTDDELRDYEDIHRRIGRELQQVNEDKILMNPLLTDYERLRYIIPPRFWSLIYAYQAAFNRTFHLFMTGYRKGKLTLWKDDNFLKDIIQTALPEDVVKYLYEDVKFQSFALLTRLLEHEIISEINKSYTGEHETEDNLRIAKQMQKTLEPKK